MQFKCKNMTKEILGVLVLTILWGACKNSGEDSHKGKLLAEVHQYKLYAGDIDASLYGSLMSHADSQLVTETYLQNWINKTLLLVKAQDNIQSSNRTEKLVEEYRNTLLLQEYENELVAQQVDSIVSTENIKSFYNENSNKFILPESIIRCIFIKIPLSNKHLEEALGLFKASADMSQMPRLIGFCNRFGTALHSDLNDGEWRQLSALDALLPTELSADFLSGKKDYEVRDAQFLYLVRVKEFYPAASKAPLSFVLNDIRSIILHERKMKLVEELSKVLYDKAKNKGYMKIY